MARIWDRLVKLACAAGGALAGLLGEWPPLLMALAVMMLCDYVSGMVVAWCGKSPKSENGGVSSKAGFAGLARKGFMLLIVLAATVLDGVIGSEAMMFQTAAVMYYIANEGISLLENAALLGVPVPKRIRHALEALKERGDEEE